MALQSFLYNTIVPLLTVVLKLLSPAFPRLRTYFRVRQGMFAELGKTVAETNENSPRIWIHAASAGEFEQARPIIAAIKKTRPEALIFISFQSDSGYDVYRNYSDAEAVFYHPVDTRKNAEKTAALIMPDVVMVMRYDFWPNHLYAAKKGGAALVLAAAVLQENSVYLKPLAGYFYRYVFSLFDFIFTVSDEDQKRFAETFGRSDALRAGDPRFDQALRRSRNTERISHLEKYYTASTLLVAGSTWEKDETLLLKAYASLAGQISMILVPHDVSAGNIARLEKQLASAGIPYEKHSSLPGDFTAEKVLVIDRLGLLAELYGLAEIAYVGGGFGINVHNTIEPAVYGIPVLFGPNHHNSPEAEELVALSAASEIHDDSSLFNTLKRLVDDPRAREKQGAVAGNHVRSHFGAAETVARNILATVDTPGPNSS